MRYKIMGSVLMILGTSLGAGMLALPVVSSQQPFLITALMLVATWLLMTVGALALLEVNLWFPAGANMVSMAKGTLGNTGKFLVWLIYLALLYCLICSYLSGAGDVLSGLLSGVGVDIPLWLADCIALMFLGSIVVVGIRSVDHVNRILMFFKMAAYVFVVAMILPQVQLRRLVVYHAAWHWSVLTVMITSFGFAIIVPSIRAYLGTSEGNLKRILLLGSVIPLVIYLLWIMVVQGLLSHASLFEILHSKVSNSALIAGVTTVLSGMWHGQSVWVSQALGFFISVCVLTSFLGVSICLIDFIADGLRLKKSGAEGVAVFSLAYLPPLSLVLFSLFIGHAIFYAALRYAGLCCILLLVFFPLLMLYVGRYHQDKRHHKILGGRYVLWFFMSASLLMAAYFAWMLI
jgi:tyrosine-specific transport protein